MRWERLGRKVALDVALGINYLHTRYVSMLSQTHSPCCADALLCPWRLAVMYGISISSVPCDCH